MSESINTYVEGGKEAREGAAARWKGIEGFNCAPGLSPAARRVGIALICFMDTQTRACFPAAVTIAGRLGLSERAVKKAKDELRKAGLIDWSNPGGPRHVSRYGFNWAKLERLQEAAKRRGEGQRIGNTRSPKNQVNGEQAFPNEGGTRVTAESNRELSSAIGERQSRHGEHPFPSMVNTRSPELSHLTTQKNSSTEHDARARGVTAARASAAQRKEDSLEEKSSRPERTPTIWEALNGRFELIAKLIDTGREQEASNILKDEGTAAAVAFVAAL